MISLLFALYFIGMGIAISITYTEYGYQKRVWANLHLKPAGYFSWTISILWTATTIILWPIVILMIFMVFIFIRVFFDRWTI